MCGNYGENGKEAGVEPSQGKLISLVTEIVSETVMDPADPKNTVWDQVRIVLILCRCGKARSRYLNGMSDKMIP
jgi:hypothetical protein